VAGKRFRLFRRTYLLSDGREMTMSDVPPGQPDPSSELTPDDFGRLSELGRAEQGDLLSPTEETVEGKVFLFERYRLTLPDGVRPSTRPADRNSLEVHTNQCGTP